MQVTVLKHRDCGPSLTQEQLKRMYAQHIQTQQEIEEEMRKYDENVLGIRRRTARHQAV